MRRLFQILGVLFLAGAGLSLVYAKEMHENAVFCDEQVRKGDSDSLSESLLGTYPERAIIRWKETRLGLALGCGAVAAALGLFAASWLIKRPTRPSRRTWASLAVAALAVGPVCWLLTSGWSRSAAQPPPFRLVSEDAIPIKTRDMAKAAAVSPDGKSFAIYTENGEFGLASVRGSDGELIPFEQHGYPPLRFSRDSSIIVTGRNDQSSSDKGLLLLMDVATHQVKSRLPLDSKEDVGISGNFGGSSFLFRDYTFSPDGKLLASAQVGTDAGRLVSWITVWDLSSGKRLPVISLKDKPDTAVMALAFAPDGKTLVAGSLDDKAHEYFVTVWNLDPIQLKATYPLSGKTTDKATSYERDWNIVLSKDALTVAWVVNGSKLYVAPVGGEPRLIKDFHVASSMGDYSNLGQVCALSPDGKIMLTRAKTSPEQFDVWDVPSAAKRGTVKTKNTSHIHGFGEFSADGKRIVILDPGGRQVLIDRIEETAPPK